VCLQAWEEDLTRPYAPNEWDHHAPYSRHIGGYRQVHRIYPQDGGTRPDIGGYAKTPIHIDGRAAPLVETVRPIGHEAPSLHKLAALIHRVVHL
jgi:hypothetical protein